MISTVIVLFLVLESLNVLLLYFAPGSKKGNALGVFKAFEKSKQDPQVHALLKYLVNWVAGTKLIFILLLVVILIFGDEQLQIWSCVALVFSIMVFYWRLYPIMKSMDEKEELDPKGYSKTLAIMIAFFVLCFALAVCWELFFKT